MKMRPNNPSSPTSVLIEWEIIYLNKKGSWLESLSLVCSSFILYQGPLLSLIKVIYCPCFIDCSLDTIFQEQWIPSLHPSLYSKIYIQAGQVLIDSNCCYNLLPKYCDLNDIGILSWGSVGKKSNTGPNGQILRCQ